MSYITSVPPLITSDSYVSASKCDTLYPFSNLTLPRYQSIYDIVRPVAGQLIYVEGTLSVYNGITLALGGSGESSTGAIWIFDKQ